ncbi:uncharacterized protein LOC106168294 [Lingula anatina]|uniref:Uncharacterized protein LOC106168294 n=1 Tax=Lingula anatina TaxID=7574 RepID=A0A1S3IXK7_LINAN|nr:uncharacterized protein LOC106168294 [Lingula anatina]|eukprot:XP_013402763.1 uncharacterized protein LOC106168294 [Lingula anatina]
MASIDIVSLLTGLVQFVGHTFTTSMDIISTALSVNYQVVSSLLKLILSTTNALIAVLWALYGAVCDVLYYLLEFVVEIFHLTSIATKGVLKLGWILFDAVGLLIHATEKCIAYLCGCLVWIARLVANEITAYNSETNEMVRTLWNGVCNIGSFVILFCNSAVSLVTGSCLEFLHFMQHVCFAAQNTVKTTISSIDSSMESLLQFVLQIPLDAYIGIVFCIGVILWRITGQGFHLSAFRASDTMEIELQGEGADMYAIDSSDDEADGNEENSIADEDDEEEEEDFTDADENSVDSQDRVSITDTDSDDGSPVEESGDSEGSDSSDDAPVHVELPQGYALRSRASPSPMPSYSKGSNPDTLVRQLESERDKRLCVVCQDQVKCVLILPCKHMCLCVHCAHQITAARMANRRICPLCRTRIEKVMNVYV